MTKHRRISEKELRKWVENDTALCHWWQSANKSIVSFVRENRDELERVVRRRLESGDIS